MKRIITLILIAALPYWVEAQRFKIPQPNQNVKDAFSLAASIYTGHSSKMSFENRINSIASVNLSMSDPNAMIAEYKRRLQQLDYEAKQRSAQKEEELRKQIDLINKGVDQALKASNVNLGTWGNLAKDIAAGAAKNIAINNANKKIEAAKQAAAQELDAALKSAMDEIYNNVVAENEKAVKEYLYAAANVYDEAEERRYIDNFKFHTCVVEYTKKNYYYKNTDWLNTTCAAPPRTYATYNRTQPTFDYRNRQTRSDVDFSNAMDVGSGNIEGQIAAIDEKLNESLKKIQTIIDKTEDPFQKVEYLDMKQQLIDKATAEKEALKTGKTIEQPQVQRPLLVAQKNYQPLLDAAIRKFNLYNSTMPYPEFLEAARNYAEAEIAENKGNPAAYAFMAQLATDIVDQLAMSAFALYLDRNNDAYKKAFDECRDKFGNQLFSAIKANNSQLIDKAISYNLIKNFSYQGKTPVAYAIELDNIAMVEKLNQGSLTEVEVLQMAIELGSNNTAKVVIDRIQNTPVFIGQYDAFGFAAKHNREEIGFYLLDKEYPVKNVMNALKSGDIDAYKTAMGLILFWSIDKNNLDYFAYGVKKLKEPHVIKNSSNQTLVERVVEKKRIELYNILVDGGYKVIDDELNNSFIELAISKGAEQMALKLIDDGLDAKVVPSRGGSLMNLVAAKSAFDLLFERLLKEGVDLSKADNSGKIPVEIALLNGQLKKAETLVNSKASLDFGFSQGGNQIHWLINKEISSSFIALLARNGIDINHQDNNGDVPLMLALKRGNVACAEALVELNADVEIFNNDKVNPILLSMYLKSTMSDRMVVSCKNINSAGIYGWTALHFAAKENKIEVVKNLLEKGASPMVRDQWRQTPYRIARDNGNKEVAKLLMSKMKFWDVILSMPITVKKKAA